MIVKLLAGLILGVQVLFFAMLPYFSSKIATNKKITEFFNNFSAGLFLGISFLHIIPQADESFRIWQSSRLHHHEKHENHHEIPYGILISIITFLFVLGIQVYMNDGHCGDHANGHGNHQNRQVLFGEKQKMRRRLMLETYLTQMALSIHSFFECMSIGIEKTENVTITLAGAIIFHKWAEALTLGFSYSFSGMSKQTAFKFAIFHSFLNAGAVLVGYQLSETSEIVKGITNAISGGTFIYICMIQKISKSFSSSQNLVLKLVLVFAGLGFSIAILN